MKKGYNPPIPVQCLEELSKKHNIPYNEILLLYKNMDNNIQSLINHLQQLEDKKTEEKLPKITVFNNGLLIKNIFYDNSNEENRSLSTMLENNEFDLEIFEKLFGHGKKEENILIEKRNEFYNVPLDLTELKRNIYTVDDNVKRIKRLSIDENISLCYKYVIGKGKILINSNEHINKEEYSKLPGHIYIGDDPTVKFKLVYRHKETVVIADNRLMVEDVIVCIENILQRKCVLLLCDKQVAAFEPVLVLKHTVTDVI